MKTAYSRKVDSVFVLIVFGVFVTSVLIVLSLSGNMYQTTVAITEEAYGEHTCFAYIRTKVKSSDTAGSIFAGEFDGLSALYIEEDYEGTAYQTVIYSYDGYMRELFAEKGAGLRPEDGIEIVKASELTFRQVDQRLIQASAAEETMFIALQAGG